MTRALPRAPREYRVACPTCERTIGAIHIVRGDGTGLRVRHHKYRGVLCEGRLEIVGWDAIVEESAA